MTYYFVQKQLEKNAEYMINEVGATKSFDLGFREIVVLDRKVQVYFVNGLVDDLTVIELLKTLVSINDDEVEKEKVVEIIKNRLVNLQVTPEQALDKATDELLSGLIVIFIDGEDEAYVVDVRSIRADSQKNRIPSASSAARGTVSPKISFQTRPSFAVASKIKVCAMKSSKSESVRKRKYASVTSIRSQMKSS